MSNLSKFVIVDSATYLTWYPKSCFLHHLCSSCSLLGGNLLSGSFWLLCCFCSWFFGFDIYSRHSLIWTGACRVHWWTETRLLHNQCSCLCSSGIFVNAIQTLFLWVHGAFVLGLTLCVTSRLLFGWFCGGSLFVLWWFYQKCSLQVKLDLIFFHTSMFTLDLSCYT